MTAQEIAAAILMKETDPQRIVKAKACAARFQVPWRDVMAALQAHVDAVKATFGLS